MRSGRFKSAATLARAARSLQSAFLVASGPAQSNSRSFSSFSVTDANQIIRILTGLSWLSWMILINGSVFTVHGSAAVVITYAAAGIAIMGLACLPLSDRQCDAFDSLLLVGTVFILIFWLCTVLFNNPGYKYEQLAIRQASAALVRAGHNPYGVDLSSAVSQFRVDSAAVGNPDGANPQYQVLAPALSFLIYVPAMLFGIYTQSAIYTNLIFYVAALILIWLTLTRTLRPMIPLLAGIPLYSLAVASGDVDVAIAPFLIVAFWRWDAFVSSGRPLHIRVLGPASLGIACAISYTAWLFVPFLLFAVFIEARLQREDSLHCPAFYASICFIFFIVPNIPYFAVNPHTWLYGAITPFFTAFSLASTGFLSIYLLVILLRLLALWYPFFKPLLPIYPILPSFLLFGFMLGSLIFAITAGIVTLSTCQRTSIGLFNSHLTRRFSLVPVLIAVAGAVIVPSPGRHTPAPLHLSVESVHTLGALQRIDSVKVLVVNTSKIDQSLSFWVGASPRVAGQYWFPRSGRSTLKSGESAEYELLAPSVRVMPALSSGGNGPVRVYAFTGRSASASSSPPLALSSNQVQLSSPDGGTTVSANQTVTLTAQVLDGSGHPVRQAGIAVNLDQTVHDTSGPQAGLTRINEAPAGQSPVTARTDAHGSAIFAIHAGQSQEQRTFYTAWLQDGYPHGYSKPVAILFGKP